MKLFDKILNRFGFEKIDVEEKMAGFMEVEIEGQPAEMIEKEEKSEYKDFIDAFRQLPYLYSGATALAVASTKPVLKIYKRTGEEVEEVEGEEINRLLFNPNPFLSSRELRQITVINLAITGNAIWNLVGTREDGIIDESNPPVELWWIKPEQIDIEPDKETFIKEYKFTASATSKEKSLDPSAIIHFKLPNPDSYFWGLGMLQPAKDTAIMEFNAVAYNKSFMSNDATPYGLFNFPEKPTKKQLAQFRKMINQTHRGAKKAGKFGFTYGGIDYKEVGKTPKDAQYIEMRKMNREEILACMGVPPSVVGLLEYANYSNMEVQQKKFWQDAVIPLLDLMADKLTLNLAPHFSKDYFFAFDYSDIKVLQEDEELKTKVAQSLIEHGVKTPNQIRKEMYNEEPYEGGNQYFMKFGLTPIGIDTGQAKTKKMLPPKSQKQKENLSFWQDSTRKKILWDNFIKRIEVKEKPFADKAEEYLKLQASKAKEYLSGMNDIESINLDKIFDVEKENEAYLDKFRLRYFNSFTEAGEAGYLATQGKLYDPNIERIFKDEEGFILTPEHKQMIETLIMESGANINKRTLKKIVGIVEEGAREKWTVEELTKNIYQKLSDLSITRSRTIARTETAKVENCGQLEGYKQSEFVELKGWLCSFVPDSRESHQQADMEYSDNPIPLSEPFNVGGALMQYPGGSGVAEEDINCLCSTYPDVRTI